MATSSAEIEVLTQPVVRPINFPTAILKAARRNPFGAVAGIVCMLLIVLAIIGPSIVPYSANQVGFGYLDPPSLSHPFGTDNLTRDMFSRIVYGARNSLGISFLAIALSTTFGVVFGVSSGYIGGKWDLFMSRIVDIMLAYPALVLVIFLVTIFGNDFATIAVAIAVILTPGVIRVVRSATISTRHLAFVESAVTVGNSPFRIMYRHILPNVAAPTIVIASVNIGIAILIEAAISFLGLGVSSALNPSWGRMLQETRSAWQLAWWTMIIPGGAISLAVVAFNVFGDALRDWLDPRLRGSR